MDSLLKYFVFCREAVLVKDTIQHVWAIRLFSLCLGHPLGTATVRSLHSTCASCPLWPVFLFDGVCLCPSKLKTCGTWSSLNAHSCCVRNVKGEEKKSLCICMQMWTYTDICRIEAPEGDEVVQLSSLKSDFQNNRTCSVHPWFRTDWQVNNTEHTCYVFAHAVDVRSYSLH